MKFAKNVAEKQYKHLVSLLFGNGSGGRACDQRGLADADPGELRERDPLLRCESGSSLDAGWNLQFQVNLATINLFFS